MGRDVGHPAGTALTEQRLDARLDILPFKNGALELATGAFRDLRWDDYVTRTTGYDFVRREAVSPAAGQGSGAPPSSSTVAARSIGSSWWLRPKRRTRAWLPTGSTVST